MDKRLWVLLIAATAVGCTKTVILKETTPVLVTASPPKPPPPPPPKRVVVKKKKIQVNEKIQFAYNSAEIRPQSFDLMNEIGKVIAEHPEIKKLRIEGHTDNIGSAKFNLDLSQRRAKSVMKYLVDKGHIDPSRLEIKGYGFSRPIASNKTDEGRAKNRRVEFTILQRAGGNTVATGDEGSGGAANSPENAQNDSAKGPENGQHDSAKSPKKAHKDSAKSSKKAHKDSAKSADAKGGKGAKSAARAGDKHKGDTE